METKQLFKLYNTIDNEYMASGDWFDEKEAKEYLREIYGLKGDDKPLKMIDVDLHYYILWSPDNVCFGGSINKEEALELANNDGLQIETREMPL